MSLPPSPSDLASFDAEWAARWPDTPPVGFMVKWLPSWVRFHSLPESEQYAQSPADYREDPFWAHIYVGATTLGSPELRSLMFMVADEQTHDVIISPPGAEWLYQPYDGGGDVVAPDEPTRDLLRAGQT